MNSGHLVRRYVRSQWRALALAAVSSITLVVAELARPWPLKIVIDRVIGDHSGSFHVDRSDAALLVVVGLLVVGIALIDALSDYLVDSRMLRAGERITHDLRVAVYSHLQRLSLGFHERQPTGDLVTLVTGDVSAVGQLFSDSLGTIATAVLLLTGMFVVSVLIDPLLAVAMFALTPLLAFLTVRFRRRIKAAARRERAKEGDIASLATEALSSMRDVKALGSESFEHSRLHRISAERREVGVQAAQIEARFEGIIDVVGAIGSAIVLVLGTLQVARGALTAGDLVVMYSYVRRVYRPLRDIAREWGRVSGAMARAERIAAVLAEEPLVDPPGAYRGPRADGNVELRDVSFAYEHDRPVIRELSLAVADGERVAVLGASGAGKSTIAALVARFYDPDAGEVCLDGKDLRGCSWGWLRDQFGLVLQDTVLFSGTVIENIRYATDASFEEVVDAAKRAGADEFIAALPRGYDTALGPHGVGLSGGQRRRIAIARTLLRDPPVLILDEPTTGLDAESEAQVLAGIEALAARRTTLTITHSLRLAREADRVVVIENGRIVVDGAPNDVLGRASVAALVGDPVPAPPDADSDDGPDRSARARRPDDMPRDPALPGMARLLDPDAMAPVFERWLPARAELRAVSGHCLRYKPRTNVVVHYEVDIDGDSHDVVAMAASGRYLARRVDKPRSQALNRLATARSPARSALGYDQDAGVMLQWLPLDLALPGLALPPAVLRRRIVGAVATDVRDDTGEEPTLLSYRPRRRAVLRLGEHVVKIYASQTDYAAAAAALLRVRRLPVQTARGGVRLQDVAITVQRLLPGDVPSPSPELATETGTLLATMHACRVETVDRALEPRPPGTQLVAAAASVSLLAAIDRDLGAAAERVLVALANDMPVDSALVVSHGDCHARQLLEHDGELALLDFDAMCAAPRAFDLGNYVAHLADGDVGDCARLAVTLDAIVEGYGSRPPGLGWYVGTSILRRSPFPFRRFAREWRARIEQMIVAADFARRL